MEYDLTGGNIQHIYFPVVPEHKIVKAQATLDAKKATFKVVVNLNYAGESYFEDSIILQDNDSIYAEPDGLVVLRDSAQPEVNLDGWNGQYIHIAQYVDGVLLLFVSREP
ncbi:MAG: hypothetical protein HN687_12495 [Candidatus Marinimicrobia bacterium]|jgi:hypothetical protein|nr:hypothetical protein [Candidatus Neomarinimicrobiota bacterium]